MKTIYTIKQDFENGFAWDNYILEIETILDNENISLQNTNKSNVDTLNTGNPEGHKHTITVEAKGYSQGDWEAFLVGYNDDTDKTAIDYLKKELSKYFTHKNDYRVTAHYEKDGWTKEATDLDYVSCFDINDIEFPEKEDIIAQYKEINYFDSSDEDIEFIYQEN